MSGACTRDPKFTLIVERTSRIATADRKGMQWRGDKWVIGAGPEPAHAPSIWLGGEAAIASG